MPKSKLSDAIKTMQEAGVTVPAAVQAQVMNEEIKPKRRKKIVTTRKVKKVFDAKIATPPPGFRWVFNRLDRPYEEMFDGMVYRFDPHEYRLLTEEVAIFLYNASLIQLDLAARKAVRALALNQQKGAEPREYEYFGEPLDDPKNVELLDRSTVSNITGKAVVGGDKTRAAVVKLSDAGRTTGLPR